MNKKTLYLIIFGVIVGLISVVIVRTYLSKEKRIIIAKYLELELLHIDKIEQAKAEYSNIREVSKDNHLPPDLIKTLNKHAYNIFMNEKFLIGKDKDLLISELKGMIGGIYDEVSILDDMVHKWCESVKNETIESFIDSKEGDEKYLELLRIRDYIISLRRKYITGIGDWLDLLLLGLPIFAAIFGIFGQIFSLKKKNNQAAKV
jgi:hypothetical protein